MLEETVSNSSSLASEKEFQTSSFYQVVLYGGHNRWEWAFLGVSLVNSLGMLAYCIALICLQELKEKENFLQQFYLRLEVLSLIIAVISLIFALHGIVFEHQYDMYLHSVMMLLALYCTFINFAGTAEYFSLKAAAHPIMFVLCLISIATSWKATHVSDWVEYRIIGVSDVLARMYQQICYFSAILRLDSVLIAVFGIYGANSILQLHQEMYWWIYIGIMTFYAVLVWLFGKFAIQEEDLYLMNSFHVINASYLIFLIVQEAILVMQLSRHYYFITSNQVDDTICISAFFLGFICMVSKVTVIIQTMRTSRTFGHGLNSSSFKHLVARNSDNLLSRPRSDLFS